MVSAVDAAAIATNFKLEANKNPSKFEGFFIFNEHNCNGSMLDHFHQQIIAWFTSYAYEPTWVYLGLFSALCLSSFGFPFPEEIVIVSVGIVCYFAKHPDIYPPPYAGAHGVNIWVTAAMGFVAVLWSDLILFYLGRKFGRKLIERRWFGRSSPSSVLKRVELWMQKYGYWASALFRFTPGLRCAGHLACGAMGVPLSRFIMVDGGAALMSIPLQILLIGFYGETVLSYFKQLRYVLLGIVGCIVLYLSFRAYFRQSVKKE